MNALSHTDWIRVADFRYGSCFGSLQTFDDPKDRAQSSAEMTQLANMLRCNMSITEFHLSGTEMTPAEVQEIVAALKCNASIKTLNLCDFDVSGVAGEAVMGLLHQVDDSGNRRHASAIETLTLHDDEKRGSGRLPLKALCAALRCNTTLTSIDLGIKGFDSDVSAELADALEHNQRVTSCKISASAFEGSAEIAASVDRIFKARFVASRAEVIK